MARPENLNTRRGQATWQQTKSALTRETILSAAVACIFEQGYAKTTTEHVSQRAGVSRGAMLHHFPSRLALIKATIDYIKEQRIEAFAREETAVQQGAEHTRIEEGIDIYWRQLNEPIFIVFHELRVAARTDPELAAVIQPAMAEYEAAVYAAVVDLFPDLALSESFQRANFLTQFMLEAMAIARNTGADVPEKMMLDWLKRELRRSFADVSEVKRAQT